MDAPIPQDPAFQQLTSNNHGPVVVVLSWMLLFIAFLVILIRLIIRGKAAELDDWTILVSMVRMQVPPVLM